MVWKKLVGRVIKWMVQMCKDKAVSGVRVPAHPAPSFMSSYSLIVSLYFPVAGANNFLFSNLVSFVFNHKNCNLSKHIKDNCLHCHRNLKVKSICLLEPHHTDTWNALGQANEVQNQAEFDAADLRQNSFRKSQFLLLMSSTDWMRPIHTLKGNLLYFKSPDCGC